MDTAMMNTCIPTTIDAVAAGFIPDIKACMTRNCELLLGLCDRGANIIHFEPGDYHFFPHANATVTTAFCIENMAHLTLEGHGARFIFHGVMNPFTIRQAHNIMVKDVVVDWERPFLSQGIVEKTTDTFVDIRIDISQYPYEVVDGSIWFLGDNWRRELDGFHNIYDAQTKEIVAGSQDNPLKLNPASPVEEVSPGLLRFSCSPKMHPAPGTYIALNHGRYITPGFIVDNCSDITLKQITIHHCLSHGVYASRTRNVTLSEFNIVANESKERVFSSVADGFHVVNCAGHTCIEHCTHTGIGDDFLNIHGMHSVIHAMVNDRTVLISRGEYLDIGDEMWLLRQATARRQEVFSVVSRQRVRDDVKKRWLYQIELDAPLPADIQVNDYFENRTWNASLTLRHCQILKRHRARGILITTPERVVVEHNYFRTAGAAILIEGDIDYWYESGGNRDVLIQHNVFEDCLSSCGKQGHDALWGSAIITITPSHCPDNVVSLPYHENIKIQNNIFKTFDVPLLRARSTGNLIFKGNIIERTLSYPPISWQKASFWFEGCRAVCIEANEYDKDYDNSFVWADHMKNEDLVVKENCEFNVMPSSYAEAYVPCGSHGGFGR